MIKLRSKKGFTLIELMIVVAIIGILAAIAIPQFANMVAKSQEGATKGNLGTIRSALSIYYGDTEGFYPEAAAGNTGAIDPLTSAQKYLKIVPNATMPRTTNNTVGHAADNRVESVNMQTTAPGDDGGWNYDGVLGSTAWGSIVVACTHSDARGTLWTSF